MDEVFDLPDPSSPRYPEQLESIEKVAHKRQDDFQSLEDF